MNEFNPYAPPEAAITPQQLHLAEEGGLWRDGPLLVMRKGAELPDRCLRCNAPAEGYRLKRKLSWHRRFWYLIVFFNLFIYIIVALIVRSTAKVAAPICPAHRSQRRRAIAVGWVVSLAGIGLFGFGLANPDHGWVILLGLVVLFFGLFYGILRSQLVIPKLIDKHFVYLKKVSPDFLEPLPEWV